MIGCRAARAARVQVARFCDPSVGSGRARDHPALCVGRAPHVHARHARLDGQGGSLCHVSSTGGQLVCVRARGGGGGGVGVHLEGLVGQRVYAMRSSVISHPTQLGAAFSLTFEIIGASHDK